MSVRMLYSVLVVTITLLLGNDTTQGDHIFAVQSSFKLKLERVVVSEQDNDFVRSKVWISKINRTINGGNMDMVVLKEIGRDFYAAVKTYEFLNNEYRPFAINIKLKFCDYLEKIHGIYFNRDLPNIFSTKCPLKQGNYTLRNIMPKAENYPDTLPFHRSMLELQFLYKTAVKWSVQIYVLLDRDAVIRERYSD